MTSFYQISNNIHVTNIFKHFILIILSLSLSLKVFTQNEGLDLTFSGDGIVTTQISTRNDQIRGMTIQSDGKIVVTGYSDNGSNFDIAVARYNSDGTLDNSFSGDGKDIIYILGMDVGYCVAIQNDDKIVIGGKANGGAYDFCAVRCNSDGTLDSTFSGDGKVTTGICSIDDGYSIAIQSDGKILIAGYSDCSGNDDFSVVRYNTDGSLDNTFSGDGKVTTPIGSSNDYAFGIGIQSDGKIVVAGYSSNGSNYDIAVVRYNIDGTLDNTFSGDGKVATDINTSNDYGFSLNIQSDGKIVVGGYSRKSIYYDIAVVRYNSDGTLDNTFSGDGKVTTSISAFDDFGYSMAIQNDGKIVVAGSSYNGSNNDIALVRYTTNGTLDSTFYGDGKITTAVGLSIEYGFSTAIQSDGKIVVGGCYYNGTYSDFAVVRYCVPSFNTINVSDCESYISPSGNYTWTTSGIYKDTIPGVNSCDSIITINLYINNSTSTIFINDCDSYTSPSGNYIWTTSGTYLDTLTNALGCDSVIAINLIIGYNTSVIFPITCESYTSPSGNYIWTTSGTYLDTIPSIAGCDSVITINLTVASNSSVISPTSCNSYTSPSGNYIWTASGTYLDTITNVLGCDSVITVNLTLNHDATSVISPTACYSYTSPCGNHIWTTSGIYLDTIPTALGCDSVITINLTIVNDTYDAINPNICDSYTSPSGNHIWTTSGIYLDTISNYYGCDSIITINLTINNSTSAVINSTACDSYTSPSGNFIWTTSGIFPDTIPNAIGCDSIITIDLTINNSTSAIINPTACDSYTSPSGNYIWTTSGIFLDTIPNAIGCDSVITIDLTINNSTSAIINPTACDSYTSPSGNYIWTTSGTYLDTIQTVLGCDSLITINLTVNFTTNSTISMTACDSYTSPSGNYIWTTSGTYIDTISTVFGCDSIITINLTLGHSASSTINQTACESYTSPSGNNTWTSSGTFFDTIYSSLGCEIIITVNLTINNSYDTISPTACDSYISPSEDYVWTTTGTYLDVLPNTLGCDSIITINLIINTVDTSLVQTGDTLTVNTIGADYQWLDCNNSYLPLSGEINQSFIATTSGSYAAVISQNNCTDTSSCHNIIIVDITETELSARIQFFPNPTNNKIKYIITANELTVVIKIYNYLGEITEVINHPINNEIDLSKKANGIYFIQIKTINDIYTGKIIKQ